MAEEIEAPFRRDPLKLIVAGHAEPGGSKSSFPLKKNGKYLHDKTGRPLINTVDANPRAAAWKKKVAKQVLDQYGGPLLEGPLIVTMEFFVHRFKSHYGTGANAKRLKDSAPAFPASPPDALKLARPVEDALTGVLWHDDSQTVDLVSKKRYVTSDYCVKLGPNEYMPGEHVVIKILQHEYATVGERAEVAQLVLA